MRHLPTRHGAPDLGGEARAIEFEAQAEELHDLRGRLAELEERVDFAERMLAQSRERESLPRNG